MNFENITIDKQIGHCRYNDELHWYWDSRTNKRYTSVTTLVGMYEQEFNSEYWSSIKAIERILDKTMKDLKLDIPKTEGEFPAKKWCKKLGIDLARFFETKEVILGEWKAKNLKSTTHGSAVHLVKENEAYEGKNKYINIRSNGNPFVCDKNRHDYWNYERAVFPELLVCYETLDDVLKIAGQVDVCIKEGKYIDILDYKTNEELKTTSFYDRSKGRTQKMKSPLSRLDDCNMNHYALQLSIYAWIITQNHPELEVRELAIIHLRHDGKEIEYKVPYLKAEVENLIRSFRTKSDIKAINEFLGLVA